MITTETQNSNNPTKYPAHVANSASKWGGTEGWVTRGVHGSSGGGGGGSGSGC